MGEVLIQVLMEKFLEMAKDEVEVTKFAAHCLDVKASIDSFLRSWTARRKKRIPNESKAARHSVKDGRNKNSKKVVRLEKTDETTSSLLRSFDKEHRSQGEEGNHIEIYGTLTKDSDDDSAFNERQPLPTVHSVMVETHNVPQNSVPNEPATISIGSPDETGDSDEAIPMANNELSHNPATGSYESSPIESLPPNDDSLANEVGNIAEVPHNSVPIEPATISIGSPNETGDIEEPIPMANNEPSSQLAPIVSNELLLQSGDSLAQELGDMTDQVPHNSDPNEPGTIIIGCDDRVRGSDEPIPMANNELLREQTIGYFESSNPSSSMTESLLQSGDSPDPANQIGTMTEPFSRSSSTPEFVALNIGGDSSSNAEYVAVRVHCGWTKITKTEWMFIVTSICLEVVSVVYDARASKEKPRYTLIGMMCAIVSMVVCISELIYTINKKRGLLASQNNIWTNIKELFPEIFGLGVSIIQTISSAAQFYYFHRHEDNKLKISLLTLYICLFLIVFKTRL